MSEFNLEGVKSAPLGRRAVLCGAMAVAFGIGADIAVAAPAAVGVKQVGQKLQISLAQNKALAKVGGAVTFPISDGSTVAVVRKSAATNGFVAINLSCTHQGVTVKQQGAKWVCPAHQSQFTLTGKRVSGFANSDLYKYPIAATASVVTIG